MMHRDVGPMGSRPRMVHVGTHKSQDTLAPGSKVLSRSCCEAEISCRCLVEASTRAYACVCIYIYACIYICIYTHIYMCIYAYTRTVYNRQKVCHARADTAAIVS